MDHQHHPYGQRSYHDEWLELEPVEEGPINFGRRPGETLADAMDRLKKDEILNGFRDNLFPKSPPLKERCIWTEKLTMAFSRDELAQADFDIMSYIRAEIHSKLGPEARIIQLYWGEEDFASNILHLKVGVQTPLEI